MTSSTEEMHFIYLINLNSHMGLYRHSSRSLLQHPTTASVRFRIQKEHNFANDLRWKLLRVLWSLKVKTLPLEKWHFIIVTKAKNSHLFLWKHIKSFVVRFNLLSSLILKNPRKISYLDPQTLTITLLIRCCLTWKSGLRKFRKGTGIVVHLLLKG